MSKSLDGPRLFSGTPFFRSAYNYDTNEASDASALRCPEPTLAQQSMKDECDLNVIMERFGQGYSMPEGVIAPTFGDFTGQGSYQDMLNVIVNANEAFDQLPARVRMRFENDPAAFVDYCSEPGNEAELTKMGLLPPRKPPEPLLQAQATSTPPAAEKPPQAPPSPPKGE